jgi:hypothetical protein
MQNFSMLKQVIYMEPLGLKGGDQVLKTYSKSVMFASYCTYMGMLLGLYDRERLHTVP